MRISLGRNNKLGLFKSTNQWLWILNLEIRLLHSSESCVRTSGFKGVGRKRTPAQMPAAGNRRPDPKKQVMQKEVGLSWLGPRPAASPWCGPLYFSWEANRKWEWGDPCLVKWEDNQMYLQWWKQESAPGSAMAATLTHSLSDSLIATCRTNTPVGRVMGRQAFNTRSFRSQCSMAALTVRVEHRRRHTLLTPGLSFTGEQSHHKTLWPQYINEAHCAASVKHPKPWSRREYMIETNESQ